MYDFSLWSSLLLLLVLLPHIFLLLLNLIKLVVKSLTTLFIWHSFTIVLCIVQYYVLSMATFLTVSVLGIATRFVFWKLGQTLLKFLLLFYQCLFWDFLCRTCNIPLCIGSSDWRLLLCRTTPTIDARFCFPINLSGLHSLKLSLQKWLRLYRGCRLFIFGLLRRWRHFLLIHVLYNRLNILFTDFLLLFLDTVHDSLLSSGGIFCSLIIDLFLINDLSSGTFLGSCYRCWFLPWSLLTFLAGFTRVIPFTLR